MCKVKSLILLSTITLFKPRYREKNALKIVNWGNNIERYDYSTRQDFCLAQLMLLQSFIFLTIVLQKDKKGRKEANSSQTKLNVCNFLRVLIVQTDKSLTKH